MITKNAESLIQQTVVINKRYQKISELSGDNFNIFKIIGLTSDEVRVHSRFIAELLNPKGSHRQGAVFLELFIKKLNIKTELHCSSATIEIEKYIGPKTENEGGQIDIFISDDSGNSIIIENKIYATDQENQLIRYNSFGHKTQKSYQLLYLTLDGKYASEKSVGCTTFDYRTISYKNEILQWLQSCQNLVRGEPVLREGITHYINLIKYLTNQTINQTMLNEIKNILTKSSENVEAGLQIVQSIESVKTDILINFWKSLKLELKKIGLDIVQNRANDIELRTKSFISKSLNTMEGLRIIIKEEQNHRFYWGGDIINSIFISGFYIREFNKDNEILPKLISDYAQFENQRDLLKQNGFNETNLSWFAFKKEQDLNFKNFSHTVCSFIEKEHLQAYTQKIAIEASNVIKSMSAPLE